MEGNLLSDSDETSCSTDEEPFFLSVQRARFRGGFGCDKIRQKIWRLLCDFNSPVDELSEEELCKPSLHDITNHPEFQQVQADVRRTLLRFPPNTTDLERQELLDALTPLIIRILIAYPQARYYQGFHDICLTVLLAVGPDDALFVSYYLAKTFFYRFLEMPMESARKYLNRIYMIVANVDWELYYHLVSYEVPNIFALSWIITWFSHDLEHYDSVTRLFDFFMTADEDMPLYVAAAMVLSSRKEVLSLSDSAEIFRTLLYLPKSVELEPSIEKAMDLYDDYPPESLSFPNRGSLLRFVCSSAKSMRLLWFAIGASTAAAIFYFMTRPDQI
ncbi:RabGAP-TBC domain containing protein [Trichuris trichiura]|uniref:RabGAP-TBC domain containing protein n=1 Tax=Trichuris trichiura TaxID=36087 RepID=A0A077ZE00_TRITR|nr:RabGAP-TBC domain containing protein [Trichuris trichiura]